MSSSSTDRKRMSVVLRYDGGIYCITKGADNVMLPLLDKTMSSATQEHIRSFSIAGLRTLVIASKKVEDEKYKAWSSKLLAAQALMDNTRNAKVDKLSEEMETTLRLVGVSAVEDQLQVGVPEAIQTVKDAGIRVWVLTGDKTETAVDIAKSCLLFGPSTSLAFATEPDSMQACRAMLVEAKNIIEASEDGGLVLDGRAVKYILEEDELMQLVFELGLASKSCVCCRLSPIQKRSLVELVKKRSPTTITLAIGDGANDVPMIEGAHLGVGIRGKEGAQAVQVSDVAISQFRFLVPLLLCHGRRAYRRVSFFLCYYLYKSIALAIGDVVWAHQNGFSGNIAFPEWLSMAFNVAFTSWHIILVLAFDCDVPDVVANSTPELYLVGPRRLLFNKFVFTEWMLYAAYHGAAAWLVPNLWFGGPADDYEKKVPGPFWLASCSATFILMQVVMLRLILLSQSPFALTTLVPTLISVLMFFLVITVLGYSGFGQNLQPNLKDLPYDMFIKSDARLAVVFAAVAILSVDALHFTVRRIFWPTPLDKIRGKEAKLERPSPPAKETEIETEIET